VIIFFKAKITEINSYYYERKNIKLTVKAGVYSPTDAFLLLKDSNITINLSSRSPDTSNSFMFAVISSNDYVY
jgi:hypothetical protein